MRKELVNLVPCSLQKGFFIVLTDDRFSVSREGIVFDRQNNEIAENSWSTGKDRKTSTYLSVCDRPVHRLVAETFLDKSHISSDEFPVVNHINGIITDNRVDNLEWTTYSGNSLHAYRSGLRTDNVRVLTKNLETDEIKSFYSIQECARFYKINAGKLTIHFKQRNRNQVFNGKYLLIKEGETWPQKVSELVLYGKYGTSKELLAHNKDQDKTYIFSSISECMRFTKVSQSLYRKKRRTSEQSVQIDIWEFIPMNLIEDWLVKKSEDRRKVDKPKRDWSHLVRKPIPVKVTQLETGEFKDYKSLETFCKQIGVKKNTVQKHILVNKGIWRGEFKIDYVSQNGPSVERSTDRISLIAGTP